MESQTKLCSCCGELKDVDLFVKHKQCKDGISGVCRKCVRKNSYRWNINRSATNRRYYTKNKVRVLEHKRLRWTRIRDKVNARRKETRRETRRMALENTIKEQLSKTCCKGVDLRREQMNNVTDLSERRKQRLVDEKSRELDYFLERIRYDINISTLEPTIMVGALASFLGRLVGTADPKLESDLLQKTKETVEIFAIREAAKINGTAS